MGTCQLRGASGGEIMQKGRPEGQDKKRARAKARASEGDGALASESSYFSIC